VQLCQLAQNQTRTPETWAAEQDQEHWAIAIQPEASAHGFSFRQPGEDRVNGLSRCHNLGGQCASGREFGREILVSAEVEIHLGLHPGMVKIHQL
jgi:hypothetical protein